MHLWSIIVILNDALRKKHVESNEWFFTVFQEDADTG